MNTELLESFSKMNTELLKSFYDNHPIIKNRELFEKRKYEINYPTFELFLKSTERQIALFANITDMIPICAIYSKNFNGKLYSAFINVNAKNMEDLIANGEFYSITANFHLTDVGMDKFKKIEKVINRGISIVEYKTYVEEQIIENSRKEKIDEDNKVTSINNMISEYGYKCEKLEYTDNDLKYKIFKNDKDSCIEFDCDDEFKIFWLTSFPNILTFKQFIDIVEIANNETY